MEGILQRVLDHSVFVFSESFFDVVLYSLSYGSRDLASQRPAVHYQNKTMIYVQNQNKQRFLKETFKTRRLRKE